SPIIHYVPLEAIMPASPTAAAGEFLMKRSAVDLVIDCQIGGRFSTSAFGCSATFKSERERFDRRRSQFDPKQPFRLCLALARDRTRNVLKTPNCNLNACGVCSDSKR